MKIERTFSKEKILELYLNEIYLGLGAYGVAAASLALFRQVGARADGRGGGLSRGAAEGAQQLSSVPPARARHRAAQLRDRPHGRGRLHHRRRRRRRRRRSRSSVTPRPTGAHIFAAEYFAEEVRRDIYENYGEKKLYEGGLSVRTTLDPKMQVLARKALIDGFVNFDEQQGYRGPGQQARHGGRLGRQARRGQGARRHRAVAARGGAGGRRRRGAHRPAAGARAGRRGLQGARDRHRFRSKA